MIKLKSSGVSEATLKHVNYRLTVLARFCGLDNPETVKEFIANMKCSNSYKDTFVKAYGYYVVLNGLVWDKPTYKWERKINKIPSAEALNKIISGASMKYATIFKLLIETGVMPHELSKVSRRDINLENGILNVQGFKGHASRTFKLKPDTLAMLKHYLQTFQGERPFPESVWIQKMWIKTRNKVSERLKDSSLKTIRLYDLRHYYATMTYYRTKDILYTKQQLGYKKIETTLIYAQLVNFGSEEYHVCVAKTLQEACSLVEQGFEYVTDMDGAKIFRKRK